MRRPRRVASELFELFGHLKVEQPHLESIDDVLRVGLDTRRVHYNTVRLRAGIGYVTLKPRTPTRSPSLPRTKLTLP